MCDISHGPAFASGASIFSRGRRNGVRSVTNRVAAMRVSQLVSTLRPEPPEGDAWVFAVRADALKEIQRRGTIRKRKDPSTGCVVKTSAQPKVMVGWGAAETTWLKRATDLRAIVRSWRDGSLLEAVCIRHPDAEGLGEESSESVAMSSSDGEDDFDALFEEIDDEEDAGDGNQADELSYLTRSEPVPSGTPKRKATGTIVAVAREGERQRKKRALQRSIDKQVSEVRDAVPATQTLYPAAPALVERWLHSWFANPDVIGKAPRALQRALTRDAGPPDAGKWVATTVEGDAVASFARYLRNEL